MPFLGTQPPNGFSTSLKQSFSGDNSTTGFTLSRAASTVTDIQVFVDNIRQEPTTAYTVSGTTLTFTEAPPTGTNNVYVVHTNSQSTGLLPPQDLGTTDYIFGDDISFNSDGAVINFGVDSEITLTHVADTGLILKHAASGDDKFPTLTLQTGDTDIAEDDKLGRIEFQAPDEGSASGDNKLVAAGIEARSEGDFSASSNATSLLFQTGASETATTKMKLTSVGQLQVQNEVDNNYIAEFQNTEATDGRSFGMRIKAGSNASDQSFVIQDHDASNTLFKITGDGDVNIGIGDILFGTAGKGINLGVTSNTDSNTLDDYEEGSHTCAFVLATSGSITPKTANDELAYIKIGTLCYLGCDLRTASTSSPQGTVSVTIPFTIANIHDYVPLGSPIAGVGITTQTSQLGSFYMRGILDAAQVEVHYNTGASNFGLQGQNSGLDGNDEIQFNVVIITT